MPSQVLPSWSWREAEDAAILSPEDLEVLARTGTMAAEGGRMRDFSQT